MSNYIVLSAPSGGGKTTIAKKLVKRNSGFVISVSATTRGRRPREEDGRDYYFMSKEEFKSQIRKNNFIEYEEVHGDYYGTLRSLVEEKVKEGKRVIFDIDVNGAFSIKKAYPEAVLIFIKAPTIEELRRRLTNRRSESAEAIEKRLNRIDFEHAQADHFDHIIINKNLNDTIGQIEELLNQ